MQKYGTELIVGDTINVWWRPYHDTITNLAPYRGPLSQLWDGKARIARFAINTLGMTIEPQILYECLPKYA